MRFAPTELQQSLVSAIVSPETLGGIRLQRLKVTALPTLDLVQWQDLNVWYFAIPGSGSYVVLHHIMSKLADSLSARSLKASTAVVSRRTHMIPKFHVVYHHPITRQSSWCETGEVHPAEVWEELGGYVGVLRMKGLNPGFCPQTELH